MPLDNDTTATTTAPQITRKAVESSNVVSVGYDDATQTLEVEFKPRKDGPAVYRYAPIARGFFDELFVAGHSVGGRIHAMIASRPASIERVLGETAMPVVVTTDEF